MTDRSEDFPGLRQPFTPPVQAPAPSNVALFSQSLATGINQIRARASVRSLVINALLVDMNTALDGTELDVHAFADNDNIESFRKMQSDLLNVYVSKKGSIDKLPFIAAVVHDYGAVELVFHIGTNECVSSDNINVTAKSIASYLGSIEVAETLMNIHMGIPVKMPTAEKMTRRRGRRPIAVVGPEETT